MKISAVILCSCACKKSCSKKLQRRDDILFDMINPAVDLNCVSVSQREKVYLDKG